MNTLKWYYNRLKLMSFKEVFFFRVPQFIQTKVKGHFLKKNPPRALRLNVKFKPVAYQVNNLKKMFRSTPFSTQYHVFTSKINVFEIEDWRKDYANGIISPINYYGNVKRQNFKTNGDVKFVAELSRFEFLPYIAFKAICGETVKVEYLKQIEHVICNWNKQNPYLKTIHWTSGIEVGIRSVNLIYTLSILKQFNLLTKKIDSEISNQIHFNYCYLKNHLSLYSSANNHLMAELMGLNVIASYFEVRVKEANKWKTMFYDQVEKQVNVDGIHMELCTRYHTEVLDQVLITVLFLKQAGETVPEEIRKRLKTMFEFTEHVVYGDKETVFGDNDEGNVVHPYFDKEFSLYNSQLNSCNYLFNTNYSTEGNLDFRNYLIFGEDFCLSKKAVKKEEDTLFKTSGYAFMYDHSNKTKLSFDCGAIGDRISAAHGHSDIFHFNLSVKNLPFIVDSGTYQYHTKHLFWRDYFRSIQAHNTISVNGKNHATNNGRMSWVNCPKTKINLYELSEKYSCVEATTDAFSSENVIHSRKIEFNKKDKKIVVKDILNSKDEKIKNIDFFLHFHPNVKVEKKNSTLILSHNRTKIKVINVSFVDAKLVNANKELPLGWFSGKFNIKQGTTTLHLISKFKGELNLETIVDYNE